MHVASYFRRAISCYACCIADEDTLEDDDDISMDQAKAGKRLASSWENDIISDKLAKKRKKKAHVEVKIWSTHFLKNDVECFLAQRRAYLWQTCRLNMKESQRICSKYCNKRFGRSLMHDVPKRCLAKRLEAWDDVCCFWNQDSRDARYFTQLAFHGSDVSTGRHWDSGKI